MAEKALTDAGVTDERDWNAIKVKRLWVEGKATEKELGAALGAARNADRDRKQPVEQSMAQYAAWEEAWDAAWGAALFARCNAGWEEQINILKNMLTQ